VTAGAMAMRLFYQLNRPWCGKIEGMTKKEAHSSARPEKGGTKEVDRQAKESKDSPLGFLEQFATLFKLRLLKSKLGVDQVDQKNLSELEARLSGKGEEKIKAETEINKLYRDIIEVDQATFHKEVTLEETLHKAGINSSRILDRGKQIDGRIGGLRERGSKSIKEEEIDECLVDLRTIAQEVGVELGVERDKIDRTVGQEVGRLHELRDRIQISKQREEIEGIAKTKSRKEKEKAKATLLEKEDFKQKREDDKRVLKVTRGTEEHQDSADKFIEELKRDFTGDQLEQSNEVHLAKGLLEAKNMNRQRLRFGHGISGIEAADEFTIRAGLIYADELTEKIVQRAIKQVAEGTQKDLLELQLRGQATLGVIRVWTSKRKDLTPDEVVGLIENEVQMGLNSIRGVREERSREVRVEQDGDGYEFVEDDFLSPEGTLTGHRRRRKLASRGPNPIEELEKKDVDMGRVSRIFSEKKRDFSKRKIVGEAHREQFGEEFINELKHIYPDLTENDYRYLYAGAVEMFGNEHYTILEEKLGRGDYEGYLKYLMSYLYKVGLREGQQDFQLQILMREARTQLADVGRSDLLDIYKAFEKTAIFHEAYYQLDREGYAKILNSWGVEPLQVFKNKWANKLNVRVAREDGTQLNELGVIKYDDLLQSSVWSHRLIYGDKKGSTNHFDEEKVYDDMLVTLLYGSESETCQIRGKDVINIVTGKRVAGLDDRLIVDGDEMSLESLVMNGRYMAGIAHDIWRLDGRCANVLDDVSISGAVGLNKALLTTWKIRRYAEEYGFIPTWMFEALSMDNMIYEIENYKDMVGSGMKTLFENKGGDGEAVAQLINDHIKRRRTLRGEEFRTNYLPIEDVRLLSKTSLSLGEAEAEYVRRQKLLGNEVDINNPQYKEQIKILHRKWSSNLFTASERAMIDQVDWKSVNAEYAKELGVESIGDTFEAFIEHFSFGRLSATEKLRGTDLMDYGGYFLKSGQVVDIFKSGFGGGATEAIAKIFGTMEGYLPYDTSGLRRFMIKEMEVMYSWDDRKWSVEVPKMKEKMGPNGKMVDGNMDGEMLPNKEIMTDENGYWVGKKDTIKLRGDSLLGKSRMRRSRRERDIEYAVYSMVGTGTLDRDSAEEFLNSKYGGIFKKNRNAALAYRWLKRWVYLDDPWILLEVGWEEGKKVISAIFKQIFS